MDRQKGVCMGQVPLVKKKIMLSKAAYAPSSYPRGRKLVDTPVRLAMSVQSKDSI